MNWEQSVDSLSHGEGRTPVYFDSMAVLDVIQEIIATYQRHGWQLRRVLLRPATRSAMSALEEVFEGASLHDSEFDGLWFARASHAKREAWELRLLAEQRYALFEAFESDESEEEREEVRREMENRMREYATSA